MKPFLQGRKAADTKTLPIAMTNVVLPNRPPAACSEKSSAGPNVEIVKKGNQVTHLIVTCSCGEKIELECLYTDAR